MDAMHQYVVDEDKEQKKYDLREWTSISPKNIPRQDRDNDVDCGIFTLEYAYCLSNGISLTSQPPPFDQNNISTLRKRYLWDIYRYIQSTSEQ